MPAKKGNAPKGGGDKKKAAPKDSDVGDSKVRISRPKNDNVRELAIRILNAADSKVVMHHPNRDYSGALRI